MMIVNAEPVHIEQMLRAGLRAADIEEVRASHGLTPVEALNLTFETSRTSGKCWAALDDDNHAWTMFGVAPIPGAATLGAPWLLACNAQRRHLKYFLANTKEYVGYMSEGYTRLVNFVDVRHTDSIRWLQWAGFTFDLLIPEAGFERRPFLRFTKESAACAS